MYQHGKTCIDCGSKKIEIHHKTYKDIGNENQKWHLLPLCRKHHQGVHNYAHEHRVNYYQATEKIYGRYYSTKNKNKLKWSEMTPFQREQFLR
jgi:hypothetical protein